MSDIAFATGDAGHALLVVELDNTLGQIEIDGTMLGAASVQQKRETLHGAEVVVQVGVALGHFRIAIEHFVDVGVGHALGGANYSANHPGAERAACGIELHNGAHDEAFFPRLQRAHAAGKIFRKHGNGAIDEIDGVAAQTRFAIERRFRVDVMRDVGDVDLQEPAAIVAAFDVDSVVEIACGLAINGDDRQFAKIFAAGAFGFGDRQGPGVSPPQSRHQ